MQWEAADRLLNGFGGVTYDYMFKGAVSACTLIAWLRVRAESLGKPLQKYRQEVTGAGTMGC